MMSERIAFQSYQRATGPLKQLSSFHTGDPIMLFTKFLFKTVIIFCFMYIISGSLTFVENHLFQTVGSVNLDKDKVASAWRETKSPAYPPGQWQGPWSLSIILETD